MVGRHRAPIGCIQPHLGGLKTSLLKRGVAGTASLLFLDLAAAWHPQVTAWREVGRAAEPDRAFPGPAEGRGVADLVAGESPAGREPPPLKGREPSRPQFPRLLNGDGRAPRSVGEGPEGLLRGDSAVALGRGARAISSPIASMRTGLARDTFPVHVHVVTHGSYCCGFPS